MHHGVIVFRLALPEAPHMIEDQRHVLELGGQCANLRRVMGKEVNLYRQAQFCRRAPNRLHRRVAQVPILDRAAARGRFTGSVHGMNPHGHDPARVALNDLPHPFGRRRVDWIEQACALEQSARTLVLEAVREVAMIVLIGLRVHDNHVVDRRLLDEIQVRSQRLGGWTIGCARMIRNPVRFKEVDMSIDEQFFGLDRHGYGCRAHQDFAPVQHSA